MIVIAAYNVKIIQSGHVVEIYQYARFINYDEKNENLIVKQEREKNDLIIKDNLRRSSTRTKQNLRNLINCNFDSKTSFLTLTFAENIKCVEQANYEFKKFKQKLSRIYSKVNKKLKYVCVIEFQDGKTYLDKDGNLKKGTGRGAVHYHLLLFDAPFIDWKKLASKWSNGFISINKCDDIDNMGAYLCKYMYKGEADERLFGKKRYFASYNTLKKPEVYKFNTEVVNFDFTSIYSKEHITREYIVDINNEGYCNSIKYTQYNLKRQNNIFCHINREDLSRKVFI